MGAFEKILVLVCVYVVAYLFVAIVNGVEQASADKKYKKMMEDKRKRGLIK